MPSSQYAFLPPWVGQLAHSGPAFTLTKESKHESDQARLHQQRIRNVARDFQNGSPGATGDDVRLANFPFFDDLGPSGCRCAPGKFSGTLFRRSGSQPSWILALVAETTLAGAESPGGIAWQSCGDELDCAQVQVPLDWDRPNGPKIVLSLIRHRASKPGERIGSLFVNFGGPGVAGVPPVKEGGAGLDELSGGRFDVIGWDPRGTGGSTHVRCFENEKSLVRFWGADWTIPSTPADSRSYVPKAVEYAFRCAALSGSLLEHISTVDTVRDLDYLRQLVGDSQLNYRGLSYGTFLGQTYINMFNEPCGQDDPGCEY